MNPLVNSKIPIQMQTKMTVTVNFRRVDLFLRFHANLRPSREVSELGRARIGQFSDLRRFCHSGSFGASSAKAIEDIER